MKQTIPIVFALFAIGIGSIASVYAVDIAVVNNGNLAVDSSSNLVGSTSIHGGTSFSFDGDHTIADTKFFEDVVTDNDRLQTRVNQLASSGPVSNNGAPSQQGAKIFQNGHQSLDLNAPEGCNDNIIYRESAGNITVEGSIGAGIFAPTYKGILLESFELADNPNEKCEWNRVIIDLPLEINTPDRKSVV